MTLQTTMNENIRFKFQIPKINSTINPFLINNTNTVFGISCSIMLKNCDIDKPRNLS